MIVLWAARRCLMPHRMLLRLHISFSFSVAYGIDVGAPHRDASRVRRYLSSRCHFGGGSDRDAWLRGA